MNLSQFTTVTQRIYSAATGRLPILLRAGLKCDPHATADKPGKTAMKLCIWREPKNGFWDRDYGSYHIVYDPQKELSEQCLLQVRYMFFLDRKQTSKGKFNSAVCSILQPLHTQHGFEFDCTPKLAILKRRYFIAAPDAAWERAATQDLEWLLASTLQQFAKL